MSTFITVPVGRGSAGFLIGQNNFFKTDINGDRGIHLNKETGCSVWRKDFIQLITVISTLSLVFVILSKV